MASREINLTDSGGVEIVVVADDGTERSVTLEPDDNGNIQIEGRGPNGKKGGLMDPSGNGNDPLGK